MDPMSAFPADTGGALEIVHGSKGRLLARPPGLSAKRRRRGPRATRSARPASTARAELKEEQPESSVCLMMAALPQPA